MKSSDMRCHTCKAFEVTAEVDLEKWTVVEKLNKVSVASKIRAIMEE